MEQRTKDRSWLPFFLTFMLLYGSMAPFTTYLNVYFSSIGFGSEAIGQLVSITTICSVLSQLIFGTITDRARNKNTVFLILLVCTTAAVLAFLLGQSFAFIMVIYGLYAICFDPLFPLLDNLTLNGIEQSGVDYGRIRLGGTIGYCILVVTGGALIGTQYRVIFIIFAIGLMISLGIARRFPIVEAKESDQTANIPLRAILRKDLLVVILLYFVFSMGQTFYMTFYSVFYDSIGGTSAQIGVIMFVNALSEIPIFFMVGRLTEKFGVKKLLITAMLAAALRWLLLSQFTSFHAVVAISLLHGLAFATFYSSIVRYVNRALPVRMRARGRMVVNIIGAVIPRIIFGYVGGILDAQVGTQKVLFGLSILMIIATLFFSLNRLEPQPVDSSIKAR